MRQLVSFESVRQPSTACLSRDGKKLLYIAGHQLSMVDLELSSSVARALSTIPLPKPLEEQAHELKMITLNVSGSRQVCIWNSGWCVVKTLPKPGFPCPVDVMLDVEIPIQSVRQLTQSTLLCVGECDQEATVHAFDGRNGQLLSSNLFPGLHFLSGLATLPLEGASTPTETAVPVEPHESSSEGVSITGEDSLQECGLAALSGTRSGDGEPTLFMYRISVERGRNDKVEIKSERIGTITVPTLPSALMFDHRTPEDDGRYRIAALSDDGKISIFQWRLHPGVDTAASGSSPAESPGLKVSARCEHLASIDNSLACIKLQVWASDMLIVSSSEGIFYIDTSSNPEDFHLVKLSGSSVLCGPRSIIYQVNVDKTVVYSTSHDKVIQVSVCIFDDEDELKKPGNCRSRSGTGKKKRGSKKCKDSSTLSSAATSVDEEAENGDAGNVRANEIEAANQKRLQVLDEWESLDLTAMSAADYAAWTRSSRNTQGLRAVSKLSKIAGDEPSTIEVREKAGRILKMVKRQTVLRKEAAAKAKQPQRRALNLSNLLASQKLEETRAVPTGPVRLEKPKDDLVVGTAKCDEYGDDIPEVEESPVDEVDYGQGADEDDEDRLTEDAPTSKWEQSTGTDWQGGSAWEEKDSWKSNDKDWWKSNEESWKNDGDSWKGDRGSYGGWSGWKRRDQSYGWWNNRNNNSYSSESWGDRGSRSGGWRRWADRSWDDNEDDKWGQKNKRSDAAEEGAAYVAEEMWQGPDGDWWFKCPSTGVWKRQTGKGEHPPKKRYRQQPDTETHSGTGDRTEWRIPEDKTAKPSESAASAPSRTSEGRRPRSAQPAVTDTPVDPPPTKVRPSSAVSNLTEKVIDLDDDELDVLPYAFPDSSDPAETSAELLASRVIADDVLD
ncbi:hypothetical protein FOZ63_021429 [Perkinsus olseni]|uniref:Uncharacterized protein n=1 Tax=Perkinsus olseni TaxID=32597 RepID=A0A7J6QSB0_PEROL|nr:hypothetical protein FOZ63_021429 [Perkinsus olseni]